MQKGETANVRYEIAPKMGTLTNDSPARLNNLKKFVGAMIMLYTHYSTVEISLIVHFFSKSAKLYNTINESN